MSNIDCLINIIGVTRLDCDCITPDLEIPGTEEPPVPTDDQWFKVSTSGFYVHELEGVVSIETVKDVVSCQKLYEFYQTLLSNSITDVADDLSAAINERYKKRDSDYVGFIGSRQGRQVLNITEDFAGLKIAVHPSSGGVVVIKNIGILMDQTAEFNVEIYRRYVDIDAYELVDTIEGVNSTANVYTDNILEEKIILPMQIENEGKLEYYFLYNKSLIAGMDPLNNLASCGCGYKENRLKKLISYGGVAGDSVDNMGNWNMTTYGNGIVLDVEVRCNAEAILCKMFNNSPEWGKYVAHAVIYKAAWKIHKAILSSNAITQEVMSNRESVKENMTDFENEYWTRIKYLVQNVDLTLTDCYQCDNSKLQVKQILL